MSQINTNVARTSWLSSSDQLLAAIARTQQELLHVERAIATGKVVNTPSEAPARTSAILMLRRQLNSREQYARNLQHGTNVLNVADHALADTTDILLEAKSIASSQVGIISNAETRANQAVVIDGQLQGLLEISNRQFLGVSVFGGNNSAAAGEDVFVEFHGGVRYIGANADNLMGDYGLQSPVEFNSNGSDGFGAISSRVKSEIDLGPQARADVRINDLNGAQGVPVHRGSLFLKVGTTQVEVDLSTIDTLGDVTTRINNAIQNINPAAGSLEISSGGFRLNSGAGLTVSIMDIGIGQTAKDLGIEISATDGMSTVGNDLGVRLTRDTKLTDLSVPIDFASGLKVTQGNQTKVAGFSDAATISDLMNVIEGLGFGLRLEINDDATSLNFLNEVSGLDLSIGETAGGTTATDLGLRTFGLQTELAEFRFGLGVETVSGEDDIRIELHDGSGFDVNFDGLISTTSDVIEAIITAARIAGLTVGKIGEVDTDVNIGMVSSGNGLSFEDGTVGGNDFRVKQLNSSLAATHLGIYANVGDASSIVGQDVSKVRTEGIFTHLINLRDSLLNDDEFGITIAASKLEEDIEKAVRARANIGVRAQSIHRQQDRSAELRIIEETMLSHLQDADLTEMITRFTQLQQQMAVSLQVGAASFRLSLLDFLR